MAILAPALRFNMIVEVLKVRLISVKIFKNFIVELYKD
jgi:hypothetical protein